MQDRIPLYSGRVTLTPVEGQANTYDMVRADQPSQVGMALSKANLLKDTTAALYGLDETAVPDDVLSWLGKYNEHWWNLYHINKSSGYKEKQTQYTATNGSTIAFYQSTDTNELKQTIQYSQSITIDQSTGAVSLKNPSSYTMVTSSKEDNFFSTLQNLAPVYIKNLYGEPDTIFLLPSGFTVVENKYTGTIYGTSNYVGQGDIDFKHLYFLVPYGTGSNQNPTASIGAKRITSEYWAIDSSTTTYEHSTDRNAYPDSGTQDGITYTYLGVPFEHLAQKVYIEKSSYIGTGTYKITNAKSVTFPKMPLFVVVYGSTSDVENQYAAYDTSVQIGFVGAKSIMKVMRSSSVMSCYTKWVIGDAGEATVYWYDTSSEDWMLNYNGIKYTVIAFFDGGV